MKLLLAKVWFGLLALGFTVVSFYDPYVLLIPMSAITMWAIFTIAES